MALDPSIPLQGTLTNPNALVQQQNIAESQQQMKQSRELQPMRVDAAKLEQFQQRNQLALSLLSTAVDQPSYEKALNYGKKVGLDVSRFPDYYDPNVIRQAQYGAMTAAQRVNNQLRLLSLQTQAGKAVGDVTAFGAFGGNTPITGNTQPPQAAPVPTQQTPTAEDSSYGLVPEEEPPMPPDAKTPTGLSPSQLPPVFQQSMAANPEQEFKTAQANQQAITGVSPAQNPADATNVAAPQSGIPVKLPTETVSAYNARLKAAGDVDTIKIMDAAAAEGKPVTYAQATALKQGKMTALQNGEVKPLPGAMKTEADMESNKTAASERGKASSNITDEINSVADQALYTKRITTEMKQLSQGLTTGNLAPLKAKLGAWAVALGLPEEQVSEELGNVGDAQAMGKLTAQLATQAMKTFTNRGTQMEFATFMANNPNIAMTPDGFNKVIEFVDKTADIPLQKQAQFMEWKRGRSPDEYQDFSAAWNQHMLKNMQNTLSSPSTPTADEWQTTPSGIKYKVKK